MVPVISVVDPEPKSLCGAGAITINSTATGPESVFSLLKKSYVISTTFENFFFFVPVNFDVFVLLPVICI